MIVQSLEIPLRGKGRTLIIQEDDVALDDDDAVVMIRLCDRYGTPLQLMHLTIEAADALRRGLIAFEVHKETQAIKKHPKKVLRHNPHTHKQGRSK
jgi:hypothetical protein